MSELREPRPHDPARRRLLLQSLSGVGLLVTGKLLGGWHDSEAGMNGGSGTVRPSMPGGSAAPSAISRFGALGEPDANGLRLPGGFTSRVIARSGERPYAGSRYRWHTFPDGGATYAQDGGGWIYVSNSEFVPGGVGALRFDSDGEIVDAYPIQRGTILNCAGGPTPWGTWLTCEEYEAGHVYECDPTGASSPAPRSNIKRALGTFRHEAAAVDPANGIVYMTEDVPDGGFYRFICERYPSLDSGRLQIAQVDGGDPMTRRPVIWHDVPQPNPTTVICTESIELLGEEIREIPRLADALTDRVDELVNMIGTPTRAQIPESTAFDGGEGIWYHKGIVFFTTKGDDRVWAYDTRDHSIEIVYDADLFEDPVLTGVDNVTVSPAGDMLVAEDGGGMQIVAITSSGKIHPVVQVINQDDSEITGPAFSPDGRRLYFSSQRGRPASRGGAASDGGLGMTYEIAGTEGACFFLPAGS